MGLGFKQPRTFGSWTFLELLFGFIMLEGFTLVVILPKLGFHPHGAANAGAEPAQAGGPNQPGGAPNQPGGANANEPSLEDRTITRLVGDLDKPDATTRKLSANALAEMKPKADRQNEVASKLTEHVNDPDDGARYQVILALGVWGSPDDVPTLVRLLTASDNLTRSAAVIAVRRYSDPRAVPGLIRCLEDAASSKAGIAALVEIGPAAEKDLIQEISNKDSPVLGAAIAVLRDIGTPDSLPALRAIANDPKKAYVGQLVRQAIKQINARAKGGKK
jgi:HEAT repeat protein